MGARLTLKVHKRDRKKVCMIETKRMYVELLKKLKKQNKKKKINKQREKQYQAFPIIPTPIILLKKKRN